MYINILLNDEGKATSNEFTLPIPGDVRKPTFDHSARHEPAISGLQVLESRT